MKCSSIAMFYIKLSVMLQKTSSNIVSVTFRDAENLQKVIRWSFAQKFALRKSTGAAAAARPSRNHQKPPSQARFLRPPYLK